MVLIRDTTVFDLPKVKSFLNGISKTKDGRKIFQGVKLTYNDNAIDSIDELKNALSSLIKNAIEKRLEDDSNTLISEGARILNTNGWDTNVLTFASRGKSRVRPQFWLPMECLECLECVTSLVTKVTQRVFCFQASM